MKTQSKLKDYGSVGSNGKEYRYIFCYYKINNNLLKIPTGCKYIKGKMTSHLYYSTGVKDYAALNERIRVVKQRVDEYIVYKLQQPTIVVNQKECMEYIRHNYNTIETSYLYGSYSNAGSEINNLINPPAKPLQPFTLNYFYNQFYDFKANELKGRVGLKDYNTLKNTLIDYQLSNNITLNLKDIDNVDFMVSFRNFMVDVRVEGEFLTVGGLNDNTLAKRFTNLKVFMKWLETNELYIFRRSTLEYKSSPYLNEVISLTTNDIKQLIELELTNEAEQHIIDMFILNCFLGLRFSDYMKLQPNHFQTSKDGIRLIFTNHKTGYTVNVPLTQRAISILNKYDYKLPKFSNQYFNKNLKSILKEKKLFTDEILIQRRVNRQIIETVKKRNEVLTSHTCRRTFVTRLIDAGTNLNAVMLGSGHRKLSTLQRYSAKSNTTEQYQKIDI